MAKPLVTSIRPPHCSVNRRASRGATGKRMFVEGGDGRNAWALRWKDPILAHVADLGGPDVLSEAQISICQRASAMECELEAMEARMSEGQPVDTDAYGRLASRLCRLLELIGIKPLARPIDPLSDLAKAFEGYAGKPADDDEPNDDEPLPEQALDRTEPGEA